jgi:predicted RNA-binding Zn ribbon-like protein
MRRSVVAQDVRDLELYGGRLCLDFANTVEPRHGEGQREHLQDYSNLVRWAVHAGSLEESCAEGLLRVAGEHSAEAEAAFGRAVELREAIYRAFEALAHGEVPGSSDLEALSEAYAEAMSHSRIARTNGSFALTWAEEEYELDRPLWPVARSAVDLLVSADPKRLKECPVEEGCGWLFYDESKNNSRKWCSMAGCGSRANMRRLYARKRGQAS